MKKTRIILLIISHSILLAICLWLLLDDFILKMDAKMYASDAASEEATRNFLQHGYSLYEIKIYREGIDSGPVPTDGTTEPAGRMEGQFQLFYFMVSADIPKVHREIQQAYVDSYNERMRLFLKNPEWFDTNVYRIPVRELKSKTNAPHLGSRRETN